MFATEPGSVWDPNKSQIEGQNAAAMKLVYSQSNPICLPQLINVNQHKNNSNSANFADIELKCGVLVAESHPRHILWALTNVARSIKSLLLTIKTNNLLAKYVVNEWIDFMNLECTPTND